MPGKGSVERIFITPEGGATMREVSEIDAVAGSGLEGDRYFRTRETGTFADWDERPTGRDITLIEQEAIEAIQREADIRLEPGAHRRNIETRDAALNHLVGKEFQVGEVHCRGVLLCEPCAHLQRLTEDGVVSALTHRGGLRADIVESGMIRPGDVIIPFE